MILPKRVKVTWRVKGGKKPDGVVLCGRGTAFGNPYKVGEDIVAYAGAKPIPVPDKATCQRFFRTYAQVKLKSDPAWLDPLIVAEGLACPGCEPDDPHCHVATLLDLMAERVAGGDFAPGCAAGGEAAHCGHGTEQGDGEATG